MAAVLMLAAAGGNSRAASVAGQVMFGQASPLRQEETPAVRNAVRKGLRWLAKRQNTDGSFDHGSVAITALSGLAFVAGGNLPHQGRYGITSIRRWYIFLNIASSPGL